jgi:hypothetical protein
MISYINGFILFLTNLDVMFSLNFTPSSCYNRCLSMEVALSSLSTTQMVAATHTVA